MQKEHRLIYHNTTSPKPGGEKATRSAEAAKKNVGDRKQERNKVRTAVESAAARRAERPVLPKTATVTEKETDKLMADARLIAARSLHGKNKNFDARSLDLSTVASLQHFKTAMYKAGVYQTNMDLFDKMFGNVAALMSLKGDKEKWGKDIDVYRDDISKLANGKDMLESWETLNALKAYLSGVQVASADITESKDAPSVVEKGQKMITNTWKDCARAFKRGQYGKVLMYAAGAILTVAGMKHSWRLLKEGGGALGGLFGGADGDGKFAKLLGGGKGLLKSIGPAALPIAGMFYMFNRAAQNAGHKGIDLPMTTNVSDKVMSRMAAIGKDLFGEKSEQLNLLSSKGVMEDVQHVKLSKLLEAYEKNQKNGGMVDPRRFKEVYGKKNWYGSFDTLSGANGPEIFKANAKTLGLVAVVLERDYRRNSDGKTSLQDYLKTGSALEKMTVGQYLISLAVQDETNFESQEKVNRDNEVLMNQWVEARIKAKDPDFVVKPLDKKKNLYLVNGLKSELKIDDGRLTVAILTSDTNGEKRLEKSFSSDPAWYKKGWNAATGGGVDDFYNERVKEALNKGRKEDEQFNQVKFHDGKWLGDKAVGGVFRPDDVYTFIFRNNDINQFEVKGPAERVKPLVVKDWAALVAKESGVNVEVIDAQHVKVNGLRCKVEDNADKDKVVVTLVTSGGSTIKERSREFLKNSQEDDVGGWLKVSLDSMLEEKYQGKDFAGLNYKGGKWTGSVAGEGEVELVLDATGNVDQTTYKKLKVKESTP